MKGRGIIFSDESVRAILAGRKTQTRRVIPDEWKPGIERVWMSRDKERAAEVSPWKVGSTLWIREAWRTWEHPMTGADGIRYRADDAFVRIQATRSAADAWVEAYDNDAHGDDWRPSLFMPRWAARLELRVTEVRVERLQEISEEDAKAEGARPCWLVPLSESLEDIQRLANALASGGASEPGSYVDGYRVGWNRINGRRSPWEDNCWVWAVTFEVIEVKREVLACPVDS